MELKRLYIYFLLQENKLQVLENKVTKIFRNKCHAFKEYRGYYLRTEERRNLSSSYNIIRVEKSMVG
jgi:hypothetical protein